MTILQTPPQNGVNHAAQGWWKFGHANQPVRHTNAWEHETFAEEQARWERSDPHYARICEAVRQAKQTGEEASQRADGAKAEWDARVATKRQANDDAQKARHALQADQPVRRQTASSQEGFVPSDGRAVPYRTRTQTQEVYCDADAVRSIPRV